VVVGLTAVVPDKATVPIPLSMVTLVASVTLQLKVELSPTVMVDGSAEKELIIGTAGGVPLHPVINRKAMSIKNRLKYLKKVIFLCFIFISPFID
jgi:hypothetical protein